MGEPNTATAGRRAPASHYVFGVVFGAIVTIALSLAVGASNRDQFWLAAGICALCAIYPSVSLGLRAFVFNHTVTRDSRGGDSVELAWLQQASAGAFLDALVTMVILAVVLVFIGPVVDALTALVALIGFSAIDAGLRYVVIRWRALR